MENFWRYNYSFLQNSRTWRTDRLTYRQTDTAWRHRPRLHSIAGQNFNNIGYVYSPASGQSSTEEVTAGGSAAYPGHLFISKWRVWVHSEAMCLASHATTGLKRGLTGTGNELRSWYESVVKLCSFVSLVISRYQFLPPDAMHKRGLCRCSVSGRVSVRHIRVFYRNGRP